VSVRIVQLGTRRAEDEGVRLGTVRRPPRGVPKKDFARLDWYDVWFPLLAPSTVLMKRGREARNAREWAAFVGQYRREMKQAAASQALDALAALSTNANFSVGCYCENEARCHRSQLRELLVERGAKLA
jgi:uncharacterized protein YeaO (DUF488 family)